MLSGLDCACTIDKNKMVNNVLFRKYALECKLQDTAKEKMHKTLKL